MSKAGNLLSAAMAVALAAAIAACAGASAEKQVAAGEYAALEQACVQRAGTRSEAVACIAGVRLALCGDGGPLAGPVLHCGDLPTDGGAK